MTHHVGLDTAEKLSKKGLEIISDAWAANYTSNYGGGTSRIIKYGDDDRFEPEYEFLYYVPTIEQVLTLLRNVHNIHVNPYPFSLGWAFDVQDLTKTDITGAKVLYTLGLPSQDQIYKTYEEAAEAGINYVVDKLL